MARPDELPRLTEKEQRALIDAWPCPVRACLDRDCPNCGWPELGQTVQSVLPQLVYCRNCGWALTEVTQIGRDVYARPLEVLAMLATRSWNRDLPVLERERAKPRAEAAALAAAEAGIVPKFSRACGYVGPIGSVVSAKRLAQAVKP
jgi:hypothetical protein